MYPYGTYRSPARLSPIALRVLRPSHRCALRAHRRHPHRGRRRPFARAHLSLQPPHRRGWGSLYAALSHGRIGEEALRKLLARHPLAESGATPVYAVDVSVWPRCDAEASPERAYYYHPSRHSAGRPIVAGWAYKFVAQLGFVRESWTAPVDVQRVLPAQDANEVATQQIEALLGRLEEGEAVPCSSSTPSLRSRQGAASTGGEPMPDTRPLAGGRRFYGDPSLCDPPEHIGRPRRHGPKMKCSDPSTWPEPSTEHRCEDAGYGAVRVRAWAELHPKVHNHERRGGIHCQDADRARLRPQSGPADEVPGGTRSHRGRCRARRPGVRGRVG